VSTFGQAAIATSAAEYAAPRSVWRNVRAIAVFVVVMVAAYGLASRAVPPAHADPPLPATANPETVTFEEKPPVASCPDTDLSLCLNGLSAHQGPILRRTIPLSFGQSSVNGLEAEARDLIATIHGWDSADPRIYRWGQPDVWGAMYARLTSIINTPAAQRTPGENGIYSWFQDAVRQYKTKTAEFAQQEYDNWVSQQCAYKPSAPTPVYDPGIGCGTKTAAGLFVGARTPALEQFQAWGAYRAAQAVGQSPSTQEALGLSLQHTIMLGWAATAFVSSTVSLVAFAGAASAATVATLAGSMAPIELLATGVGTALGGLTFALAAVALTVFILAVVSLILSIVQVIQASEIPVKLQAALNEAKQAPDLKAMLNSAPGMLYSVFASQTLVERPPNSAVLIPAKPNWHGDKLKSQTVDLAEFPKAFPVGPVIESKAVSVKSWGEKWDAITKATPPGGSPPPVIWLTDRGWFQQSIDGGTSWTTESSLRYLNWSGNQRVAMIQGGKFIDFPAPGGVSGATGAGRCDSAASTCRTTSTLQMLDANGTPIMVTLDANLQVPATITDNSGGTYTQGQTTTFTNPEVDSRGGAVTYKWEFESRCPVTEFCSRAILDPLGNVVGVDPFHGNPVETKTGQSVSFTWPTAGTFHVRLTTTNAGGSRMSEKDITVGLASADATPVLSFTAKELGPIFEGGTAKVRGCLSTVGGKYVRPTVTVDWGDGTVASAQPASVQPVFVGGGSSAVPAFVVRDGASEGCTTAWSFAAAHTYASASANGSRVSVQADDGEGRTTSFGAGTVTVIPTDLQLEALEFTNPTQVIGGAVYKEGEEAELKVVFANSPNLYGASVVVDWDQSGRQDVLCNTQLTCAARHFLVREKLWSKPGNPEQTGSETMVHNVSVTLRDAAGSVTRQFRIPVVVLNVPPKVADFVVTPAGPLVQGQEVTLTGTLDLADPYTPVVARIVWRERNGSTVNSVTLPPGARTFEVKHVLRQDETAVVALIADDAGGLVQTSKSILAANKPPFPAVDPRVVGQGTPMQLDVVTNDAQNGTFTQRINWGDGSPQETVADVEQTDGLVKTPFHTYQVPGTYNVSVTLFDGAPFGNGEGSTTTTVTVENVAPQVVGATYQHSFLSSVPSTLTVRVRDGLDLLTGTIDWRDGSTSPFSVDSNVPVDADGIRSVAVPHEYVHGGQYPVLITVTDDHGATSPAFSELLQVEGMPSFTGNDPGDGVVGQRLDFQFAAHGFPAPTYDVVENALPPGLTLGVDGYLYGTPTTPGTYTFRVRAGNTTVAFGNEYDISPLITMHIRQVPAFTAETPPEVVHRGTPYSYSFAAAGVPAPTFTVATGTLPPGITLNSSSGLLSGTPTTAGLYTFAISASNAAGSDTTPELTILVKPPEIRVTSPNGGESWLGGVPQSISWTWAGALAGQVKIELLKGGSVVWTITKKAALGTNNAGAYNWTVPASLSGASTYAVRVTSLADLSITDTSDAPFVITHPSSASITVVSPNGGESWSRGTEQEVKWTSTGNPGANVEIVLIRPGKHSPTTIVSSTPLASGSYRWTVPISQVTGSKYTVRIRSTTATEIGDTSDANFTIN
jgi:hypothetical protein